MNDRLIDDSLLLPKLRSAYKRLGQFTWTIREIEEKLPYGEQDELLLKEYLAMILDLEDIFKELKSLKKEYVTPKQENRNSVK